jgi:two-component sensor histidine kinase
MLQGAGRKGDEVALDLVEEINHRLVNEYAEAIAALALTSRDGNEAAQGACEKAAQRLHAHAEAHRSLLPPTADGLLNAGDYLRQICGAIGRASLAESGIRLIVRTDRVALSPARCWRLGMIVAELIRNAARHGLSRRAGLIVVRLATRAGSISCLVCDTGRTYGSRSPGRGRRLATALASDLGGDIDWSFTSQGGVVALHFPEAEPGELVISGLAAATHEGGLVTALPMHHESGNK